LEYAGDAQSWEPPKNGHLAGGKAEPPESSQPFRMSSYKITYACVVSVTDTAAQIVAAGTGTLSTSEFDEVRIYLT